MSENPPTSMTLDAAVRLNLESYFRDLEGTTPHGLYEMVIRAVERPLLEIVLAQAEGNQSRAAEWLGINRNTLRRKLLEHKLTE
jgi:Fis family transcriptional regulator